MNELERARAIKELDALLDKIESNLRSIVESIKSKKLKNAA
jgi:hypothetical protein